MIRIAGWVVLILATVVGGALSGLFGAFAMALAGVLAALVAGLLGNWAVIAPAGYYTLHRFAFGQVASAFRDDDGATGSEHALPAAFRVLSATGTARVVGRNGDHIAILLPQDPPARAGSGFVHLAGPVPASLELELPHGRMRLVDGTYLGDGWWWV